MIFSVAHATARPKGWQRTFQEAMTRAYSVYGVEYVLSIDERFGEFTFEDWKPAKILRLDPSKRKCAVENWNNAIDGSTGDVIIVNSDDFSFPNAWDAGLDEAINGRNPLTRPFVIHVSTGSQRDDNLMTLQIFSRALLKHWGYGLWPEYDGMYVDDDYTVHAYNDPSVEVIQARHLMFEHLHFSFGKSEHDEVYAHENRSEGSKLGAEIFRRRRLSNFQ